MSGQCLRVLYHFCFVVYPVQRGVDGLFEAASAFFAPVALYAEAMAMFAIVLAAAFGAGKA